MSSNPQQKTAKKIGLNSVISWGASVVIIGLMFKILHLPGGTYMIAVGLLTESFLFFILGIASMTVVEEEGGDKKASGLEDLLATAITPKVIERLSMGFQQFNKTVESVNQIAGSFNVTQNLIKEIEVASGDVKKFRDNMSVSSTGFGELNKSLQAAGQMAAGAQGMMKDFDAASNGLKSFSKNMTDMNSNCDQFNKSLSAVGQMSASAQGMMKDFEVAGSGLKSFAKNMTDMTANLDQFAKNVTAINQMTASTQNMLKEFEAAAAGMRAYNKNITDLSKVYAAQLEAFKK